MSKVKGLIERFWNWLCKADHVNKWDKIRFEIYEDGGGKTRWRLLDDKEDVRGRCAGNPHLHVSKDYLHDISEILPSVEVRMPAEYYFEVTSGKDFKYYWRLIHQRDRNLLYIAVGGEGFGTKEQAINDLERFRGFGRIARIVDTRKSKEDSCTEASTDTTEVDSSKETTTQDPGT